jgi:hypothetical protein
MVDLDLAKTLFRWARNDSDKTASLEQMLDDAVAKIASGSGASMASATANGVSVNLMSGSLTVSAWAATLSHALALLENPPVSVVRARIV